MPRRKRDYAREYQNRVARGAERGFTRSQARGHPAAGLKPLRLAPLEKADVVKLEAGYKALRRGSSLTKAAKENHIAPERLRRYLREQHVAERRGRRWVALDDKRPRTMLLYSGGEARTVTVGRAAASDIGTYFSAVGQFLETNDPIYIRRFDYRDVTDIRGVAYPYETDPNTLYRLASAGDNTFEQIYNIGGRQ
jgi:hypothetical protein